MSLPGGTDANESRYDLEMIAHIRSARAQAADDQWSIRLTLGEVDALLRAVDDRDDLKRRLVGEWEGDIPEPRTVVEVVPHVGDLGEKRVSTCGRMVGTVGKEGDSCGRGMSCANLTVRPWTSAGCPDA